MLKIAEKILNGDIPTLCFFGDSVTHGEFEFQNGFKESAWKPELAYHKLLADRIRETYGKEITVINAGVGGNFSGDGLKRIQTDVLDKKPDFCCVMFGTNDVTDSRKGAQALEEYKQNLRQIVGALRDEGIEVALMTPGMLCSHGVKGFKGFWWFVHKYYESLQKGGKMDAYAQGVRDVAKDLDVPLADVYAEWKQREADGVDTTALLSNGMNHPTPEMHRLFADKLFDLIFNGG
ncbi:MAG: hypothetical protein IJV40_08275 [Oscillospiraceae bacterium]|nr:hypothetical protein [Oscillospiraceae bacterium]